MIRKLFLFIFVFLLPGTSAFAENFYIKNYNVDLKVDNTKKVHVVETIDAYFTKSSHGIIRDIPAPNAEITNIRVSENNKLIQDADGYSIQIGDKNKFVNGNHTYKITYDYKFFDNKNEFYFNIIGTNWETNIDHVKFKVEMPEKIDGAKTGLSIGKYGTIGFYDGEGVYNVKDKNITGETLRTLEQKEGVTIRIEVPQGYFVRNFATKQNISLNLMLLLTFLCILIWFIFGKDEKPISIVNFYPPQNINALDVEFIYNEYATTKGIVAMIVDLAQKGYLKITDNKDGFVIEKCKRYDGSDNDERTLINAIFNGVKQTATEQHLKKSHTFYKSVEKIIENKNNEKDKLLYEPEETNKTARQMMRFIICLLGLVLSYICAGFSLWNIFKGIIVVSVCFIGQIFVSLCISDTTKKNPFSATMLMLIIDLIVVFSFYIGLMAAFNIINYVYLFSFWGFLCVFVSLVCYYHLRKRNKRTLKIAGELEGLKKFIKTAEINKLQMLVDENPQYFYNILPYTYIFNLSDKWIKKFENIMKPNDILSEGTEFKEKDFNHFVKTMNSLSVASYDNGGYSSSSSGGGSSYHSSSGGGGHSGGGGGGGGGHSW